MMNNDKQAKQTDETIKICIVAVSAYSLLAGKNPKVVVGSDVHPVLLAKELMKHNFEVTFITHDEGGGGAC